MYTNAISYYFETRRKICETQHTRAQIKLHFSFEKCVFWHEPRKQNETRCKGQNRPDEKKPSERKNQTNKREKRKQFKTALSRKNRTRTKVFFAEFTIKTRPRVFNKCIRRSCRVHSKTFRFSATENENCIENILQAEHRICMNKWWLISRRKLFFFNVHIDCIREGLYFESQCKVIASGNKMKRNWKRS